MSICYLKHRRHFFIINIQGIFISTCKSITFRRIYQSRRHAGDSVQAFFSICKWQAVISSAPMYMDVWDHNTLPLLYRSLRSCLHTDCYSVCHTCNHSQIMGYQYGSCSKLHLYFPQKIQDLCLYGHIQCSSWFICK